MSLQIVRKRLFDIQKAIVNLRVICAQSTQDLFDIFRLFDRAVEISAQPFDALWKRQSPYLDHASVIPIRVIATQLYLEALQTVALDPVLEQHRVAIIRLRTG